MSLDSSLWPGKLPRDLGEVGRGYSKTQVFFSLCLHRRSPAASQPPVSRVNLQGKPCHGLSPCFTTYCRTFSGNNSICLHSTALKSKALANFFEKHTGAWLHSMWNWVKSSIQWFSHHMYSQTSRMWWKSSNAASQKKSSIDRATGPQLADPSELQESWPHRPWGALMLGSTIYASGFLLASTIDPLWICIPSRCETKGSF